MSDDTSNEPSETSATNEKDSVIADLQSQLAAVKAKADELLSETKKAKQKAREEAEAKDQARKEKAKREGDFEQLLKSSEKERSSLQEELQTLKNKISTEKVKSEAMKVAAELADGTNAQILSRFIEERIKYTDDGIKVTNQNGELTVSSLDDLKREFTSSDTYKVLLRGNQSTGGSAPGNVQASGTTSKQIDRSTFDKMDDVKRMAFFKSGGTVTDNQS